MPETAVQPLWPHGQLVVVSGLLRGEDVLAVSSWIEWIVDILQGEDRLGELSFPEILHLGTVAHFFPGIVSPEE